MKKLHQKIISVMATAALIISSITISASAFYYTGGTSCGGARNSQSTGCENSNTQKPTCTSGYDSDSNASGWNAYGSSAYGNSSDGSNTAGTSTDWMDLVKQHIENCTKNRADNNNESAAENKTAAPANSSATGAATEAAACNNGATAAEGADSYAAVNSGVEGTEVNSTADTAASKPENSSIKQSVVTVVDDTGSCATCSPTGSVIQFCSNTSGKMMQCLSGLYEKCSLSLQQFGICLRDCSVPIGETTQPSGTTADEAKNTETDGTDAVPAESNNATTQPQEQNTTDTTIDHQSIDNLSFEEQVVALVNKQRAENGLSSLTLSKELSNVARIKSQDMHDKSYFSHTSPTYGSPFEMLTYFGISYRAAGENIAMGYATPEAVMTAWMNSSGHRANILSASYTQIGVGYVANGNYWTQEFIG